MGDGVSKITKNFKQPTVPGRYIRLSCLTGKNKGTSYFLTGKRVVIGRSEQVDIQILDPKSSREHAEIVQVGPNFVLTDLGSQNGVIVNDLKITQHQLKEGDKIIIGQTVMKFDVIEVKDSKGLVEVDDEDDLEEYEEEKETKKKKGKAKEEKKKKPVLLIAGVILAIAFLLPDQKVAEQGKKKSGVNGAGDSQVLDEMIDKKQREEDKELREKLQAYIHRGLREYREGNYFRAIEEFNLALIMSPSNGDANFYLNRTKQKLDEQIETIFLKAKQEAEALKYNGALISYCEILRLLQDYPEDKRFIDAKKNIEYLEQQMGMDKGDYKCY
ncbi:MAG: hypothetical protein Fur0010_17200 [Bdellovibrio sp.]